MRRDERPERRVARPRLVADQDVELELTQLTFRDYTGTVIVGSVGTIAATILLALHYRDPWLWRMAVYMLLVCSSRTWCAFSFDDRRNPCRTLATARRRQAIWAVLTLVYSGCMAVSTLYNYAHHDITGISICIMGSFAIASGLSARMTVQPRVLQACGLILMAALGWAMFANCPPLLGRTGAAVSIFYATIHFSSVKTKFEIAVEHLRLQHKLRDLAERDTLTGLANRRHFHARLESLCAGTHPFAVLYLDLDRFKRVNDNYGHAVGDSLLKSVAERLSGLVRVSDLLARLGGDEFAILQHPGGGGEAAQALASRITKELAVPFHIDGQHLEIGSSIGIRMAGTNDRDPDLLLNLADQALYRVKQAGGGGFRVGEFQN